MEAGKTSKSTQEQAIASWINYLNQVRIDRLMGMLSQEQDNLDNAMNTINETLNIIGRDIVNNGLGRGGERGMHGFIAEVAEVGIGNARELLEGRVPVYEWINDNGPEDLRRGAELIQQKFVNSGGHLSLQAVKHHLLTYPDFLENGGKYQIPSDHYERIKWLLSISEKEANKMPTSSGEFSLKQWREVHNFFRIENVPLDKIEPSVLDYRDVQKNMYEQTMESERQNLQARNQQRRFQVYQENKPTLADGIKTTAMAAAAEGAMAFCMGVAAKRRSGKKLKDFDQDDWKDITIETGVGTIKGGVRGSSIYLLTNHTAAPAAVASAIVTASFGVAEQAHRYRKGELDEAAFIENSEILCLDAAVSALSSFAGQVIIPVPVIGAVIGNAVGTMLYQLAKENLSDKEQALLEDYLNSTRQLDEALQAEYQSFIVGLSENMKHYMAILERAFSPDVRAAFNGSVALAKEVGVPVNEILDTKEKVFAYFVDINSSGF